MKIAGLLLAAGSSRRFGSDKLVSPLGDSCVGVRAARALRPAVDRAVAVVRPGDQPLAELLSAEAFEVVPFAGAARGMGASLAFGISVTSDADGWLVALADMPFLDPETVARISARLRLGADRIVAPSFRGRRGHPVGFRGDLLADLLALEGDFGARALVAKYGSVVATVECDDQGVLLDVDTLGDLDMHRGGVR